MKDLIGKMVLIRTVTMYHIGVLNRIEPDVFVLTGAVWVANTGRFSEALSTGRCSEVEAFPIDDRVYVSRLALVDVVEWHHALPVSGSGS